MAHGRAHFALGQAVRAGEIQFGGIDTGVLAALDDFAPGVHMILLHHGGDEDSIRVGVLGLFEFIEPDVEFAVADEFDVLPADHFLAIVGHQFGVARADVDDFGTIQANGFGDHTAPTFPEGAFDHLYIGPRRAGADDKGVLGLQAIDGGCKGGHGFPGNDSQTLPELESCRKLKIVSAGVAAQSSAGALGSLSTSSNRLTMLTPRTADAS